MPKVGIIGIGDRFEALATLLGRTETEVLLYNVGSLKPSELPDGVVDVPLSRFEDVPVVFLSLPIDQVRSVARELGEYLTGRHAVVHLCRNFEHQTLKTVSTILAEETPTRRFGFLTGPMNKDDVEAGRPASGVCATVFPEVQDFVEECLVCTTFRLYRSNDMEGAEVAAAYCRVIAMAAGVASVLDLGDSLRATLFSRGLAEMGRFVAHRAGRERTTFGMSGSANLFIDIAGQGSPDFQIGAGAMRKNAFEPEEVVKEFGPRGKDLLDLIESLAIYLEDAPELDLHLLETCHLMVSGQMGPADAVRHLMSIPTLDD